MATERFVLPTNVRPTRVELHLRPNFEDFTFTGWSVSFLQRRRCVSACHCDNVALGTGKYALDVKSATNAIKLNALDITVTKAFVQSQGTTLKSTKIEHDAKAETVQISLSDDVKADTKASLELEFNGTLNDKMIGFYRSKFEHAGKTKWMATTQFEPADARVAFPCWDEPGIKCVWAITMTVPKEMTAVSNMPDIETVENSDGTKTVKFSDSPTMSSYLVAFVCAEMEHIEKKSDLGILVRVFTQPGKGHLGRFALDYGAKVVDFFSGYYQLPYPLPKLDLVSIPDFNTGAMENWGLITFRERLLVFDDKIAPAMLKFQICGIISHEIAHQWFGNLVTMEWWKELWLNEGFANYVQYISDDHFHPEWDMWMQFLNMNNARALIVDARKTSHPIEVDVSFARNITEIFDDISYMKGATVIRYVENFLGSETFKKGLSAYLSKFKYGNAKTADLWNSLSEVSGKDVSAMMDKWTSVKGYPVLSVEETDELGKFKVTQHPFISSGEAADEDTIWHINIGVITKSSPKVKYVEFKDRTGFVHVDVKDKNEWVKFNANVSGFFRVAYSPKMSALLGQAIKNLEIPPADRFNIENDAFALARSGAISLVQALEIAQHYVNENHFTVWFDLAFNINDIFCQLKGSEAEYNFNKFIVQLYSKIGETLGWDAKEGDSDLSKRLRELMLERLAYYGHKPTIDEALRRYQKFLADPKSVSSDLQLCITRTAVRYGGEVFEQLLGIYKTTNDLEIRMRAMMTLANSFDPALVRRALDYMITGEIRLQDSVYMFRMGATSYSGRLAIWQFIKDNWNHDFIEKMQRMITEALRALQDVNSEGWLAEVEEFFKTHSSPHAVMAPSQTIEMIRGNLAFLKRNKKPVTSWLASLQH